MKKTVIPTLMSNKIAKEKKIFWFDSLLSAFEAGKQKGLVNDIIVHGSYGDYSYTGFSDLDITVLLTREATANKSKLLHYWSIKYLNPMIISIDPLQHHGAFFLKPDGLENYDELLLPLVAYSECWSLTGKPYNIYVERKLSDVTENSKNKLNITIDRLINQRSFFKYGTNMYSIKRFLSNFFIVPVYYYQYKSLSVNKKKAINLFYKEFKNSLISKAFQNASNMRNGWPFSSSWQRRVRSFTIKNNIPQGKLDMILLSFFRNKTIEKKFKYKVMPLLVKACLSLKSKF